jgi:hypothetical protein
VAGGRKHAIFGHFHFRGAPGRSLLWRYLWCFVAWDHSANGSSAGSDVLTSMTYPDGYVLTYGYSNAADAAVGRPTTISDSTGTLASLAYLGSGTQIIGQTDNQAGINLAASLNQFGQVASQNWTNGSTILSDSQYLYNNDGMVTYASESATGLTAALGGSYNYTALNQLHMYLRGMVTISNNTGSIANSTMLQVLGWDSLGNLLTNTVNGVQVLNNTPNAQNQNSNNEYASNGDTTQSTNAAGSKVNAVFNAWGQPVSYTVSQTASSLNFTQTETIQYDALGRPLGEFESGTFPGEANTIQTQHTLSYNALNGRVISDTNAITTSATAPEGTDPARYVYAPNGTLLLREMGTFGATTPSQYIYALTDPTGTVVAIASTAGAVYERYVFDGLGNGQALQANGTPYDAATFSNSSRSANWEFQQQFSGSVFDPSTQLLQSEGTDYAWSIVYQGNMYDGIPGVYITPQGEFNPRQQSMLSPDLSAIQQGISAYDPTQGETGFTGWYDRNAGTIAKVSGIGLGIAAGVLTGGLADAGIAAIFGTDLGVWGGLASTVTSEAVGNFTSGTVQGLAGGENLSQSLEQGGISVAFGLALRGGFTGAKLLPSYLRRFVAAKSIAVSGEAHIPVTGSQWYDYYASQYGAENVGWSRLPAYAGGKTTGVLSTSVGDIDLISGYAGPAASVVRGTPGFNIVTLSHVEGHASAAMDMLGIDDATLYLNRIPCGSVRGCNALLPRMLGEGRQLRVIVPGQMNQMYVGVAP